MPPDRADQGAPDRHPRARTIAGLREIADLIEAHPEWDFKIAGDFWIGAHISDADEFMACVHARRTGYSVRTCGHYVTGMSRPAPHLCIEFQTDAEPFLSLHAERMERDPAYRRRYQKATEAA